MIADSENSPRVAVRLSTRAGPRDSLERFLIDRKWQAAGRFEPKDDDDLNAELCAGAFARVVFADLDELLECIWMGEARLDRWEAAGVKIELATPPADRQWLETVRTVYDSLSRYRARQRRRQIGAASILSAIALAAMAVLFGLVPPSR